MAGVALNLNVGNGAAFQNGIGDGHIAGVHEDVVTSAVNIAVGNGGITRSCYSGELIMISGLVTLNRRGTTLNIIAQLCITIIQICAGIDACHDSQVIQSTVFRHGDNALLQTVVQILTIASIIQGKAVAVNGVATGNGEAS